MPFFLFIVTLGAFLLFFTVHIEKEETRLNSIQTQKTGFINSGREFEKTIIVNKDRKSIPLEVLQKKQTIENLETNLVGACEYVREQLRALNCSNYNDPKVTWAFVYPKKRLRSVYDVTAKGSITSCTNMTQIKEAGRYYFTKTITGGNQFDYIPPYSYADVSGVSSTSSDGHERSEACAYDEIVLETK